MYLNPPAPDVEQGGVNQNTNIEMDAEHLMLLGSHYARKRAGDEIHISETVGALWVDSPWWGEGDFGSEVSISLVSEGKTYEGFCD